MDIYGDERSGFTSLDSINILLIANGLRIPGRVIPVLSLLDGLVH
jgi:hypothetical protein